MTYTPTPEEQELLKTYGFARHIKVLDRQGNPLEYADIWTTDTVLVTAPGYFDWEHGWVTELRVTREARTHNTDTLAAALAAAALEGWL